MNGMSNEFVDTFNTFNNYNYNYIEIQNRQDIQKTSTEMFNLEISNQVDIQKTSSEIFNFDFSFSNQGDIQKTSAEIFNLEINQGDIQNMNKKFKIEDVEVALSQIERNQIFSPIVNAEEIMNDLISSIISEKGKKRIKRPLNKFMVFKKNLKKLIEGSRNIPRKHRMRQITHVASKFWNGASKEEKKPFEEIAKTVKSLHKNAFPNYSYSPVIKKPLDPFVNLFGKSSHTGPVLIETVEDLKQPIEEQIPLPIPQQECNLINSSYLFEGHQHFFEGSVSNGIEIEKNKEIPTTPQHPYNPTNVLYPQMNHDAMVDYQITNHDDFGSILFLL
ncbi:MATA-HMG [Gigaspora margarita]|uniref:MATA-HMG n=1 Tax=Gigaspora margarita TaxID=4874 RepID=A0A8H4AWB4_GIGMA|nr:MATA-HMG [Gigaspora margarita]